MNKNIIDITVQKLIELNNSIKDTSTHKLEEMAEIGRQGYFIIKVFGKEGPAQHFHIYTAKGKQVCLQFKDNAYFAHDKYTDTLNNAELKDIMEFMRQPNKDFDNYTNWEVAIRVWNISNPNESVRLDTSLEMPIYKSPRYDKK